jgi:hypothetical protein
VMEFLEPGVGGISHALFRKLHDVAIFASQIGLYLCTGQSVHPIADGFDETWRKEYESHENSYNNDAWAVNDVESRTFKIWVGEVDYLKNSGLYWDPEAGTYIDHGFRNASWCLDYKKTVRQEQGGGFAAPLLSFDSRERLDYCGAILKLPGSRRGHLFTGSGDGLIRRENYDADTSDDSDVMNLRTALETRHYMPLGYGGDDEDANQFVAFWLMGHFDQATSYLWGGDTYAAEARRTPNPDFSRFMLPIPAHQNGYSDDPTIAPLSSRLLVRPGTYFFEPDFAGRGFTLRVTNFEEFAGFGYTRAPGLEQRGEIPPDPGDE